MLYRNGFLARLGDLVFAAGLALAVSTCKIRPAAVPASDSQNVFGLDDRVPMLSARYPWSAIGRLDYLGPSDAAGKFAAKHCTGFLVWRNIVLTNAHCVQTVFEVPNPTAKKPKQIRIDHRELRFSVNMVRAVSPLTVPAIVIDLGNAASRSFDWAILRVEGYPGDRFGWLTLASPDAMRQWSSAHGSNAASANYSHLILPGYSGLFWNGKTAGVHMGCKIRGTSGVNFRHDCDSTGGSSGSPIFAWDATSFNLGAMVFALHAGHTPPRASAEEPEEVPGVAPDDAGEEPEGEPPFTDDNYNVAVKLNQIRDPLARAITQEQQSVAAPQPILSEIIRAVGAELDPEKI
jgi:hypothetical protein